ncbi:MAG: cell division protein SepF [Halolamina sp.]
MGIMSKILGGGGNRSTEDYVTLDLEEDFESPGGASGMHIQFAEIAGQQDVIAIKDAVYDGDLVIADITRHSTTDSASDRIIDELRQVAQEVDGDIVQKGDDQIIIAPTGVGISREKLN